ncbi:hypothetical protein ACKWTF_000248 [Chironomus riparius]
MKFLISFILLGLSGRALGGGYTDCGALHANYLVLLQASQYLLNETLIFVNSTVHSYPYVGNSYIGHLECNLDLSIQTMAIGTSQLSGISPDYIFGIFNGTINPPFVSPLDCIRFELLSFNTYVQNLTDNVIPEMKTHVIRSPINESTPCPTVVQIQSQYFANAATIVTSGINVATIASAAFASVGLSSLFLNLIDSSKICTFKITADSYVEFYNVNSTIVDAFIANQSTPLPAPISCVRGILISQIESINSTYNNINNSIANPSIPSRCEPFYSDFRAFKIKWFQYIDQLRFNTINISVENPVLTPFFIADLICELDVMIMFAANATSFLSGVDAEIVYAILNGETVNPLPAPLDCVETDLIYMKNEIAFLVNNVIPGYENFAINSTSDTSTCNTTYTALTGYVVQLVDLLNMKGFFVTSATALFTSTNLSDLFLESFTSIIDCIPDLVAKYVGAVLNADGSAVKSYVNGNRKSLPYPFSCAEILIDITNSLMNQALVNYVTESPNNLVLPNIPKFRG